MSYRALLYHIVFRTQRSRRTITEAYERDLYANLYSYLSNKGAKVYRIGGMPDHIHILVSIPPTIAIAELIRDMKRTSAKYLMSERHKFPYFEGWGRSYGIFSYCHRDLEMIRNYIINQKEHHKKISFADELRKILQQEGVEYDENFFLKE